MTVERNDALRDAAIGWHMRLPEADAATWEAFADWLGADPAHAAAYDEVELALDEADAALHAAPAVVEVPALAAANDDERPARRRQWIGGAVAAALVLAIGFNAIPRSDPYTVQTGPGETRALTLASGDRIELNGGSRVVLDRKDARFASLEQGEAAFTIRHDPAHPFALELGDARIVDLGTVFNVARDEAGVRVAVAEGSVRYEAGGDTVRLGAGQALSDAGGSAAIVTAQTDPAAVAAWRQGRLTYSGATLAQVSGDLARSLGVAVVLDPSLADRSFTGTIRVGRDPALVMTDVAALLDVSVSHGAAGWRLLPHGRANR